MFEPLFSAYSYGFRPGRSAHEAVKQAQEYVQAGYKWAVDINLEKFFDNIDHQRLIDILQEKIQDDRLTNLIHKFLKAGYLENWEYHKTYSGTPQGSVITPPTM